jgi:hypothetical protein
VKTAEDLYAILEKHKPGETVELAEFTQRAMAVGRAVRFSIVAINIIDLFLSLAIWGSTTTVRIAG